MHSKKDGLTHAEGTEFPRNVDNRLPKNLVSLSRRYESSEPLREPKKYRIYIQHSTMSIEDDDLFT
jgi:hypothetical protein